MAEGQNAMANNRSMLREFIGFVATKPGDLSNITAPPFVLDTKSTVEMPAFWAENTSVFCAPAQSEDPAERALLVLKWYLSCLRNQNYMGHSEDHGVKKPLNAFLGELFLAKREDEMGTTRLVSEQVSHHPPITACRVWNEEHGVAAAGYTRQAITFNGNVTIKQTGHALFTLSKRREEYLIPLPDLKVKGIFTGTPYPELNGTYYIPSTNGYMSMIDFSGKGWFSGSKHSFEAMVYKENEGKDKPLYTITGTWNKSFVIRDVRKNQDLEIFNVLTQSSATSKLIVEPVDEQDPWETRRAWRDVISALNTSDMKGTTDAKNKLEQGQRSMRKDESREGSTWQPAFFKLKDGDETAELLAKKVPGQNGLQSEKRDTHGVWAFDSEKWSQGIQKPYHGEMTPDNTHRPISSQRNSIDSAASRSSSRNSSQYSSRSSVDSQLFDSRKSSQSSVFTSPRNSSLSLNHIKPRSESLSDIAKNMPEPQVEQVLASEQGRRGSGIDGMSVKEKGQLEDMLRDMHMTGKPRRKTGFRKSRLSIDSSREHMVETVS